jgi:hypothetical protein
MTPLTRMIAIVLVALALASCTGPADSQVEADARAIVKQHLGNAADVHWLDYTVVDGDSFNIEWYVGLVLIGKSNQRVSEGAFQGLVVSDGAKVPKMKLHMFYRYQDDIKTWELDAFSVTLPNQPKRGPVWEYKGVLRSDTNLIR